MLLTSGGSGVRFTSHTSYMKKKISTRYTFESCDGDIWSVYREGNGNVVIDCGNADLAIPEEDVGLLIEALKKVGKDGK